MLGTGECGHRMMPRRLHMLDRSLAIAVLLPAVGLASLPARAIQGVPPEDRVLGHDVEIRLPSNTQALAKSLASIARASGVLIGFETVLDTDEGFTRTQFGWSPRGQRVGDALDSLVALHPAYEWRTVKGVIHVRPRAAVADPNHFLNQTAGRIELKQALPLHATFEAHRVFVPDCVVRHPIYTDRRDEFLENEDKAMRKPVTLSFKGGTVLELVDAVIKAHGSLYWNVTYRVPPERLHDAVPRYEYAIFGFSAFPQTGGWWRMCVEKQYEQ
jgi:hypothetical protein